MNSDLERCPLCGSQIARDKLNEIRNKIRNEEQKRLQETEANLRKSVELEKLDLEKTFKTRTDSIVLPLKDELNDFREKVEELEAEKDEFIKKADEDAKAKAAEELNKELKVHRLIFEKDSNEKILKLQENFSQEREGYLKKIHALDHQLQKKTLIEVEGSSFDLANELQLAFSHDEITCINKGEPNEKLVYKVIHKGLNCGVILIDHKNRQSWQKNFAINLRKEQMDMIADHAILATTSLPKGKKELCIEEGVIVADPNCVIPLVDLLRKTIIKLYQLNLTTKDRDSKVNRLYDYISSESFVQKQNEAVTLTNEILELDVLETKQHQKNWEKRGRLATQLKSALFDIDTEISGILEQSNQNKVKVQSVTANSGQLRFRKDI